MESSGKYLNLHPRLSPNGFVNNHPAEIEHVSQIALPVQPRVKQIAQLLGDFVVNLCCSTSAHVLLVFHWLQVIWVDARRIPAKVVQLLAFRHRTVLSLEKQDVSMSVPVLGAAYPVSVLGACAYPLPAGSVKHAWHNLVGRIWQSRQYATGQVMITDKFSWLSLDVSAVLIVLGSYASFVTTSTPAVAIGRVCIVAPPLTIFLSGMRYILHWQPPDQVVRAEVVGATLGFPLFYQREVML